MKILLIDTCGVSGSIALADTGRAIQVLGAHTLPGRSASERLLPAVKDLMARSGVSLRSLAAIAVVSGPGSFTGVRVGVSAAKGLSEAAGLPLVAISRLAVLAGLAQPNADGAPAASRVHAVLDAGRGEFYCGEYLDGMRVREALLTRDELLSAVRTAGLEGSAGPVVVTCEALVVESLALLSPQLVAEPVAADALSLAAARMEQGQCEDVAALDANYVRRTDAEIFAKPTPVASTPNLPGARP